MEAQDPNDDDASAIQRHNKPRPVRKARKASGPRPRTTPLTDQDDAEIRLHRTAVAALDPEERAWISTQAVIFMARGQAVEVMVGEWIFPHETVRYGYIDNEAGDAEYCVMVRLRGSDRFIQLSTGIVHLAASGRFVEASRTPIVPGSDTTGYVIRIISIEELGSAPLPTVAFADGRLASAVHMADVVQRYASSFVASTSSVFAVGRRRGDAEILQRLAIGEATAEDMQRWADHHRHPWEIAEAIDCSSPDEFMRSIETMKEPLDLDEDFVVTLESTPSSNVGVLSALWATQRGNSSTWIPSARLFVRFVSDRDGFQLVPIA